MANDATLFVYRCSLIGGLRLKLSTVPCTVLSSAETNERASGRTDDFMMATAPCVRKIKSEAQLSLRWTDRTVYRSENQRPTSGRRKKAISQSDRSHILAMVTLL